MRVDANTRGHLQWYGLIDLHIDDRYYFKIDGMSKGQKYKLNIVNFTKMESLYKRVSWDVHTYNQD